MYHEVPSLTIKTAGVLLSNGEEQLSATPIEDKDSQGGTQDCSSNEHQLVNQDSTKKQERLMEGEYATICILIGWCKEKLNSRERSCSMDLKIMSPRRQCRVTKVHVWGRKANFSIVDTTLLFFLPDSCCFGMLVAIPLLNIALFL